MSTSSTDRDQEEVMGLHLAWHRVHHDWFVADREATKTLLRSIFPAGDRLHMFNADGKVYRGPESIIAYWEQLEKFVKIEERPADLEAHVQVDGDLATVHARFTFNASMGGGPVNKAVMRGTEIYRRDDGAGNRAWRMWHCHYSQEGAPVPPPPAP